MTVGPHLAHFALTVSSEEGHIVDFIHHHKVLLLSLEILHRDKTERMRSEVHRIVGCCVQMSYAVASMNVFIMTTDTVCFSLFHSNRHLSLT